MVGVVWVAVAGPRLAPLPLFPPLRPRPRPPPPPPLSRPVREAVLDLLQLQDALHTAHGQRHGGPQVLNQVHLQGAGRREGRRGGGTFGGMGERWAEREGRRAKRFGQSSPRRVLLIPIQSGETLAASTPTPTRPPPPSTALHLIPHTPPAPPPPPPPPPPPRRTQPPPGPPAPSPPAAHHVAACVVLYLGVGARLQQHRHGGRVHVAGGHVKRRVACEGEVGRWGGGVWRGRGGEGW